MSEIDFIIKQQSTFKQLSHGSNIVTKYANKKTTPKQKKGLEAIASAYSKYLKKILALEILSEKDIKKAVKYLNEYYNFIHSNDYDNLFSSQGKFRPTILEEFLFFLFRTTVDNNKELYDKTGVLSSGGVKAYTNLYFKAKDFPSFIQTPEIGVNEKDQDYAIYRTFELSIDNRENIRIRVPAVAIEAKTYIDKTMLDSIIATAEKIKSGNPYTRFIAVAERYDVSMNVDPSYSRIDQIYVLRKGMRKDEWKDIDSNVVQMLYEETIEHLNRPWSDVSKRLCEQGKIL